jgi:hypothetical protein
MNKDNLFEFDFTPKKEYDYIDEKGDKKKHTPRQYKLREFYDTHSLKGLKNENEKIEAYHDWLIGGKYDVYFKFNFPNSREYRKDKYALKHSELMHKVITSNGIPDTFEEAEKYALKGIKKALHEVKLAYQVARKVEKQYQQRIVFCTEKEEIAVCKGE